MDVRFWWTVEDTLHLHDKPKICNSDQGVQFTSHVSTSVLEHEGIAISMNGRGRALGCVFVERLWRNVKYENQYLKGYDSINITKKYYKF